jgi:extracellular elastinolytic metalloproteinase
MITSVGSLFAALVINAVGTQGSTLPRSEQKIDVNKFRLQTSVDYVPASEIPPKSRAIPSGSTVADYVKTATTFVQTTLPNATFRLVGDHYIGVNGIGHVYFKQTAYGIDIDNADFNVNVSIF